MSAGHAAPVPPAVARAAAASEAIQKAVYNPDPVVPVEGQPTEPEVPANDGQPPLVPHAHEIKDPTNVHPAGTVDWESRYKAMKGRHDRLVDDNRQLLTRISNMEEALATRPQPAPQPAPAPQQTRRVTPEEEQEFGTDMLDVVGRRASEVIAPEMDALKAQLTQLQNQLAGVGQVQARRATETVYQTLDREVPDWRDINMSDSFLDWLSVIDPYARQERKVMLKRAFDGQDAQGVLNFFKGYLSEVAAVDQRAPAATPTPEQGRPTLEDFAAPGKARPAAHTSPAEKPTYTRAQIAQFYTEKAAGKWRGREQAADLLDADIFAAQAEGRVIG